MYKQANIILKIKHKIYKNDKFYLKLIFIGLIKITSNTNLQKI